jgi:hypothetical protein
MQAIFPTGIPAPSANFYPPHLMVAGGNAQQQAFYPFFQPLNGTQQQLREGNKPLEGLDQQQKQMREIVGDTAVTTTSEVEDTRNRSAGVKVTGGASRQHSGMDRASLASSRGSTFIQEQVSCNKTPVNLSYEKLIHEPIPNILRLEINEIWFNKTTNV